ncbi:haloacid dehalogenase superfamily enzyme, subfamily IA [Schinkia azotoformans MEV2011]|uniref:Haloacid dehalogenase superfamily enzyme, subfamily IA n=1 Tax=Schinkia azotoformans MEV2011 TaxID=1348973 RepID=A0A072NLH3_SCHAZ|nr:HAD-IA family hydrolase [Schinkia azotoformans]KEF38529.1 haloacid dehalogenase superfamily enzyme, subfamily IA [Schinkia azotoformans MEV2011]MEC1695138.1 HAD-IA family hydrolase [Schinkia azotoformans]MEC1717708.1 HAD-IA family hydrolase [Schinkia azotoformans]MEC1723803.1 HAD-IA family hydrolase [Schinkia azotoformans]MEC1742354.1 HAD-IA family hydrolase [Schinkia azotoformans]
MLKYVIFDFDGTLADSRVVLVAAWNSLAKKHNFKKLKLEELDALKKLSIKERSRLLQIPLYKVPIILPQFFQLYRQGIKNIKPYDGIKEMLNDVEKKGCKIAIISSNSRENILYFLKHYQIKNIKEVLCSSKIHGKDRLIIRFLREKQLKSSEVVYVGDEHRDVVACKKTGVQMIWVGWGYDAEEVVDPLKPDYKVYTPAEILKVIK